MSIFPDPLSPLFKEGGLFEALNEDAAQIAMLLMLFVIVGKTIIPRVLPTCAADPTYRYFAIHAVANAISTVCAAPDLVRFFANPQDAFLGPSWSQWSNSAVAAIHLYHVALYSLPPADIFHHLSFVSVLCGLAIPYKQQGGVLNNVGCFVLSGLPGGIDYVCLCAVKEGWLSKRRHKHLNARIQQWIRGPVMSALAFNAWSVFRSGRYTVPTVFLGLAASLHLWNGVLYSGMAIESYARFETLYKQKNEAQSPGKKKD